MASDRLTRCVAPIVVALLAAPVVHAQEFDDAGLRTSIAALYPVRRGAVVHPSANPTSAAKVALGRTLFFDPLLSSCGAVACASCHQPSMGWSSPDPLAEGCDGARGYRRAPSVEHVAFQGHFFWDGRATSAEAQALLPVVSASEMGNTWDAVLTYLTTGRHEPTGVDYPARRSRYADAFVEAFDGEITATNVARAIAAFERSLVPGPARIDRWLEGDDGALAPIEKHGLALFFGRANCSVCHPPPHFTDDRFHNIGVPTAVGERAGLRPPNGELRRSLEAGGWRIPDDVDLGRQAAAPSESPETALGAFKTPSLRNVAARGRFMHNGVFDTLEDVMRHYETAASGDHEPVVGELAFYVRYRKAFFGPRGGGAADDIDAVVALMAAFSDEPVR